MIKFWIQDFKLAGNYVETNSDTNRKPGGGVIET